MLPRTLEPEVMDTPEEACDYDAMDHSEVNRIFVADFLQTSSPSGPVLDVGTGTAQIPIELCRQFPSVKVTAIDLAQHMLRVAEENVKAAALTSSITLQFCDAKQLPFEDHFFAASISNSIVHHIPEPTHVLREIVRVTAPGGVIFVRDLLRPISAEAVQALVQQHAGEANAHQQKMFGESLHAALTVEEMQEMVSELGFSPETVTQTTDRHWTWSARKSG